LTCKGVTTVYSQNSFYVLFKNSQPETFQQLKALANELDISEEEVAEMLGQNCNLSVQLLRIKSMPARAHISTNTFSKAYLAVAWKSRNELQDYERRGFGQFFYLTICGHIESLLSVIIKQRVDSIKLMVRWDELPSWKYTVEGQVHNCKIDPLVESLWNIMSVMNSECENAPLGKLTELYNKVFSRKISEIIEKDLSDDLNALVSLRNLFAHGRDLFIDFDDSLEKGNLDTSPLKKPAERLHLAGIIEISNLKSNLVEFHSAFYSDKALLYFYNSVQRIEKKLLSSMDFLPEKVSIPIYLLSPLPDLETESL
jgi:hypothetical protein